MRRSSSVQSRHSSIFLREVRFASNSLLEKALGTTLARDCEVRFGAPEAVYVAWHPVDVLPVLCQVEEHVAQGAFAAGFLAYEAAAAFDAAHAVHSLPAPWPYAAWGIYPTPEIVPGARAAGAVSFSEWQPRLHVDDYVAIVHTIRSFLEQGHTYQVNFTFPLDASFDGDALTIYANLVAAQPTDTCAYLDLGTFVIVSASPELFFELDGHTLRTRPMKGTLPRGLWPAADRARQRALWESPKQRAENVMIVDLLRNDMGRVSTVGTVKVDELFALERYPTVWQMTSTISSRTHASVAEIFRALFPCGSVTGAPKIRTMEIIRSLERWPRGVYCGAIGWMAPGRLARFSVPIRTLVLEPASHHATYHVGGGIVIDSDPAEEYEECLTKARIIMSPPWPEFSLLETLRYADGRFDFLEQHLARLEASAEYFSFPWDGTGVRAALEAFQQQHQASPTALRVRLVYSRAAQVRLEAEPLKPLPLPLRVAVGAPIVDPSEVLLYHKTTHRSLYEQARASYPLADDVILRNCDGYVTESTIANVVVELQGQLYTPPLACGLLPGILRDELIRQGRVKERLLTPEDLHNAEKVYLVNSVRGWLEAKLVGEAQGLTLKQ